MGVLFKTILSCYSVFIIIAEMIVNFLKFLYSDKSSSELIIIKKTLWI